jgi:hypothetical protein
MGGGGKSNDDRLVKRVSADTKSRDGAAPATKEFLQERSGQQEQNTADFEKEIRQLAPAPARSLDGLVPDELLREAEGADARRKLPYAELEAKKVAIEDACADLEPDFQNIARAVTDGVEQTKGHLEGRDLQQHQPICLEVVTASFQLLLDRIEARKEVDVPPELAVSLEAVQAAKESYERCNRQLYGNEGNDVARVDEDDDDDEDEDGVLPDAATMIRCTDAFKMALEAAYALMTAHIEEQETQLEQNSVCSGAPDRTVDLPCVKKLQQQQHEGRLERARVEAVVEKLGETNADIATEQRARQEALQMHSVAFSKERQSVEQEQATLEEKIANLTRSWQDLEATRKHYLRVEDWLREQQRMDAAKFESDKQWIAEAIVKLGEKVKDCCALDAAIEAELALVKRVEEMANSLVGGYSEELRETMSAHLKKQKEMFDSRYEVYYRRQKNMESQLEQKQLELNKLRRQNKDCVRRGDIEGAENCKQRVAEVREKINVLKAEVAEYTAMLVSLGEQWEGFFVPRQEALRDHLDGSFRDEREDIEVDVDKSFWEMDAGAAEDARREADELRKGNEGRRTSLDAKMARVMASRNMLTDGPPPPP